MQYSTMIEAKCDDYFIPNTIKCLTGKPIKAKKRCPHIEEQDFLQAFTMKVAVSTAKAIISSCIVAGSMSFILWKHMSEFDLVRDCSFFYYGIIFVFLLLFKMLEPVLFNAYLYFVFQSATLNLDRISSVKIQIEQNVVADMNTIRIYAKHSCCLEELGAELQLPCTEKVYESSLITPGLVRILGSIFFFTCFVICYILPEVYHSFLI